MRVVLYLLYILAEYPAGARSTCSCTLLFILYNSYIVVYTNRRHRTCCASSRGVHSKDVGRVRFSLAVTSFLTFIYFPLFNKLYIDVLLCYRPCVSINSELMYSNLDQKYKIKAKIHSTTVVSFEFNIFSWKLNNCDMMIRKYLGFR